LFSWVLLSLGAPFWFDALKNLLRLRSVMARKDDVDRQKREDAQTTSGRETAKVTVPRADIGTDDEAGNLAATGALG
ncbi:MAG TPA: hypothetical protein VFO48_02050, partial [Vicinamibacterales bacterium]|nr:hypothetical protein [Vicinamibacterales bacterium]